jgi:hypothetical protein
MQVTKRSLKRKMITRISTLLLFIILFVFLYFPYMQGKEATEGLIKRARVLNEMIASSLVAAVEFNDSQTMQGVIKTVQVDSDLSFVAVVSPDKKVLVSINEKNIMKEITKSVKDTEIETVDNTIVVYTPVKSNSGNIIATSVMGFRLTSIEQYKMVNRLVSLLIFGILSIFQARS